MDDTASRADVKPKRLRDQVTHWCRFEQTYKRKVYRSFLFAAFPLTAPSLLYQVHIELQKPHWSIQLSITTSF